MPSKKLARDELQQLLANIEKIVHEKQKKKNYAQQNTDSKDELSQLFEFPPGEAPF